MKLFILILCLCFTTSLCQETYHENEIWGKPCVDDDSVPSAGKSVEEIIRYSTWVLELLDSYKDEFVLKLEKHHQTFRELVENAEHNKKEWLRNFFWFTEEILPKDKVLGKLLSNKTIEEIKAKIKGKDKVMTEIDATLKFFLRTFSMITKMEVYFEIMNVDLDLRRTLEETVRLLRSLTCSMNNYTKSKKKEIQILVEDFLPKNITHIEVGLMLRDTFNYLEYIKQLFESLKLTDHPQPELTKEPDIWANPCHYSPPVNYYFNKTSPQNNFKPDPKRAKQLVQEIAIQAKRTFEDGLRFKDQYAKVLTTYPSFDSVLNHTINDEWLRKVEWYQDEVLPESKQLFSKIPESYISKHLMTVFPRVIPLIHKANKLILSGLDRLIDLQMNDKIVLELEFKPIIEAYLVEVQYLLCVFSDYLRARGLQQRWLFTETRISRRWVFAIYRDSLNYLEYISQVFEYISKKQALGLDPFAPN